MFLGMKNAKEGGCSSYFVHILNVIFFQTLSWQLIAFFKIFFFFGKILKITNVCTTNFDISQNLGVNFGIDIFEIISFDIFLKTLEYFPLIS